MALGCESQIYYSISLLRGHVSAVLYAPVQQYCGWFNAKHALLQAITVPSAPLTAKLASQTAFTLAAQLVELQPEPPCGVIEIGRVNSAKEAGGIAPAPLHSMTPEAQSAVAQTNFPDASVEHCVLAQKRPAHVAGALSEDEAPAANVKPVEDY
ncbi:hypothetical protein DKX38_024424 [Salix brachista]|uniref:Uncharacterized protein n=1 Tax=Salix brachista TaxID=2182728 RepID=A0A5N5JSI1_9ROSI|nr:hypothetical protein DKX38_024424 [Salix brachista]